MVESVVRIQSPLVISSRRLTSLPLLWLTAKREKSSVAKAAAGGALRSDQSHAEGGSPLGFL